MSNPTPIQVIPHSTSHVTWFNVRVGHDPATARPHLVRLGHVRKDVAKLPLGSFELLVEFVQGHVPSKFDKDPRIQALEAEIVLEAWRQFGAPSLEPKVAMTA